ncbi:hypothetical protein DOTSEDRAFT_82071 [Dothistroma septosporum NZE10]|uniref:C2H2-type domain-containing protein n=1 Tax=Dothistroma septosporum (strain NZE10 / CBS 128990) TaxID=675120 RepID=N1PIG3_DOTSN|nr:hypothetical protein DOTSEDRAFT_82071 [Dothistroma septosporum NZE10]
MAPRSAPLPQATTESAREARKAFFCDLCQKGYSRMPDFEAHQSSYDHLHRRRLKETRQMTKDPGAAARAREADSQNSGLKSIALPSGGGGSTGLKKKPVFKSTLQPQNASVVPVKVELGEKGEEWDLNGAVRNGWKEDEYDLGKELPEVDWEFRLTDIMTEDELREMDEEIAMQNDPRLRGRRVSGG